MATRKNAKKLSERGRPKGLTRFFVRAPLALYRARLGFLLGKRFLHLEHLGRKSGLPRDTVLEVVHHDPADGTYYVCSGWGEKADWFRNVMASPDVTITVGTKRMLVHAERLDETAATAVLTDYAGRNPTAFRNLSKLMLGHPLATNADGAAELAAAIPAVAFRPR